MVNKEGLNNKISSAYLAYNYKLKNLFSKLKNHFKNLRKTIIFTIYKYHEVTK